MDLQKPLGAFFSVNKLIQETDQLKTLQTVLKENPELLAKMHSFSSDTLDEALLSAAERKQSGLWQNTFHVGGSRRDAEQNTPSHRAASPVDFKYLLQNCAHADMSERTVCQSVHAESPPESKIRERVLGEIAYQLDQRILSYIFQGHTRLYGFTLLNIPEKIIEVSRHPLTRKVDEGYWRHLTQRYTSLMEQLIQHGYKTTLHPTFTAFIVNTYGILRERSGEISIPAVDYQNPDYLKKVIMSSAPARLQKDLLLILSCLCTMAKRDRKPLVLL